MHADLKSTIDRQIDLTIEAIYASLFVGPSPKSVSFRHVINRVMILVQAPITFALLRSDGKRINEYYCFNKHVRHERLIKERIQEAIIEVDCSSNSSCLYRLFETDFYLLVLDAHSPYDFPIIRRGMTEEDVFSQNLIYSIDIVKYKLRNIFSIERYSNHPGFLDLIEKTMMRCNDGETKLKKKEKKHVGDPVVYKNFESSLLTNTTHYDLTGFGTFDRVFKKLNRNLIALFSSESKNLCGDQITNFLFFSRDYYDEFGVLPYVRHGETYNYRIRILVCSDQRKEFVQYLKALKDVLLDYPDVVFNGFVERVPKHLKLMAMQANARFIKKLKDNQFQDILNIFGNHFSVHARSMADPVFDGVVFFRDPFTLGGVDRCFTDDENNKYKLSNEIIDYNSLAEGRRDDALRVVICFYLFIKMANLWRYSDSEVERCPWHIDEEKMKSLRIMLVPMELGGKVWGVAGHITNGVSSDEFVTPNNVHDYAQGWLQNHHIFHGITERFKKNLRTYMGQLYEKMLGDVYAEAIQTALFARKNKVLLTYSDFAGVANNKLLVLSSVFPYDLVQLKVEEVPNGEKTVPVGFRDDREKPESIRRVPVNSKVTSVVCLEDNPYFKSAPGLDLKNKRFFVHETDVAVAMADAMVRFGLHQAMTSSS